MTELTHMNSLGEAAMVDVSSKAITYRSATASARISLSPVALSAIKNNTLEKGEALGVARIAGILAAKKTPDLIPLCHSLPLGSVEIDLQCEETSLHITATVTTEAKTGVEMEALTACTIAALTVYDMTKALDKSMIISDVKLLHKSGGRSGEYRAGGE